MASIRSKDYGGFNHATGSAATGSGFLIWSGSEQLIGNQPTEITDYYGVGMEMIAHSGSYFRFQTDTDGAQTSALDIRTDIFFLGSDAAFISGSGDGTIAISSSNFELLEAGKINATAGDIGPFVISANGLTAFTDPTDSATAFMKLNTPEKLLQIKGDDLQFVDISGDTGLRIGPLAAPSFSVGMDGRFSSSYATEVGNHLDPRNYTAKWNISSSKDVSDPVAFISSSEFKVGYAGQVTASSISASGQVFEGTYHTWEASALTDTGDDSNWQGPPGKGIYDGNQWNVDLGSDYDDNTTTNTEVRTSMNAGWKIPDSANYSCSIKTMDIYIAPARNITFANDDNFSCSLWYSTGADIKARQNVDTSAGFVQRHAASVVGTQCGRGDGSTPFIKFNNYYVSQSIDLELGPGAVLYPVIKTFGTNNFNNNIYWIVNYCKIPL